jgi:hypothetical protein
MVTSILGIQLTRKRFANHASILTVDFPKYTVRRYVFWHSIALACLLEWPPSCKRMSSSWMIYKE